MSWFDNWKTRRIQKWGRGIAKTKLRSYHVLKTTYPEMPKEELYFNVIKARLGYSDNKAREIMQSARDMADSDRLLSSIGGELTFRHIVDSIIFNEAPEAVINGNLLWAAFMGAHEIIPEDV